MPAQISRERLVHLLSELERQLFRITTLQARESVLSFQQFLVLDYLEARGVCRPAELQAVLGVGQSSTSELTSRMMKAGLLTKTRDPADQRAMLLEATPKGREALQAHQRTTRFFYQRLFGGDPATTQGLCAVLETLLERFPRSTKEGEGVD